MRKKKTRLRISEISLSALIVACLFVVARFHSRLAIGGGIAHIDGDEPSFYAARTGGGNNGDDGGALCHRIASALDPSSWPDVVYHKDRRGDTGGRPGQYDVNKFNSVEEEDEVARSTVDEFNKLRTAILTPQLLDLGLSTGRLGPARAFAGRLRTLLDERGGGQSSSLIIAVFGTSFTIGSNCGESTVQTGEDCAWPMRLARRFDDIFPRDANSSSLVEWRMLQENAQGSVNIAQKLPMILDEFRYRNATPDVILLDNTISDSRYGVAKPWFEAVVRAFLQSFPDVVVVSLIDAVPAFVDMPGNSEYNDVFTGWLRRVQAHYGLAVVDVASMVRHLRLHVNKTNGSSDHGDIIRRSIDNYRQRQQRQHPVIDGAYKDGDSDIVDLLWPQASDLITANGTLLHEFDQRTQQGEVYWLNFLPRTRKTKVAWYPQNHPPWATHQYVADAVMHALLSVVNVGLGCNGSQGDADDEDDRVGGKGRMGNSSSTILEETVSPQETLNDCFICHSPTTKIDAKSPHHEGGLSVANLTSTIGHDNDYNAAVAVTCGDWKWITDTRHRSGWQSDKHGSLIRFRLRMSKDKFPTLSLVYMRSHESFGSLMVTFRAVSRKEANGSSPPSLLGCDDIDKFRDIGWEGGFDTGGKYSNDSTLIPSLELDGTLSKYSLWETVVFPGKISYWDVNTERPWYLLNRTVLSRMTIAGDNDEDGVEYVDMYVMNPHQWDRNRRRVKIQVVTSC
ncbi:hypothetical protein ACHAW5_004189 [Stephanodiscus triporus]|uniref:Membrane-associated protein n=1 Tax=Stephanodiscus triporus TaxID=2934178 RepID=A0ABD3PRY9_9STRA